MAQPMLNLGGNLSPEQQIEQQQIARQQRMAELLMQQGQQTPQGQMVSGRYVAPSFFQYAAPLLQGYLGKKELEKVEQRQLDIAKQLRADETSAMTDYFQQLQPQPAQPAPAGYDLIDAGTPAIPANPKAALLNLYTNPKATQAQRQFAFQKMNEGPMKVGAEDVLLDPTTLKPIYQGAGKPTTDMQNFEFAKNQGFKGSFTDFKNQITPYQQAQLNFDREKFEFDKANKVGGKDLTESQGKASAFQSQMVSASNAVNTLEAGGFDPTLFKSQTAVRLAGGTANPLVPVTAQQYKQAQDQWSEAYLRFKTGAAATEQEVIRNNRTYFPVFGDKPDQIAQKAMMREQAERDVGIAAGRGAGIGAQPIGQQPKTEKPKDENVDIQSQLRTKGIPYQPKLYEYRINSDGSVDRKKKTQ